MTITDEDLKRWEAEASAATPGPWTCGANGILQGIVFVVRCFDSYGRPPMRDEDAAFIAAARTAVPDLCAEVRRLQGEKEGIRRALARELHENVPMYAEEMTRLEAERDTAREVNDTLAQANLALTRERDQTRLSWRMAVDAREEARADLARMQMERDALRGEVDHLKDEKLILAQVADQAKADLAGHVKASVATAKERDAARAEAGGLRACLADAVGKIELMADIVAAARWHRHGYGKDPKKLLHDAVDAYEKAVKGE